MKVDRRSMLWLPAALPALARGAATATAGVDPLAPAIEKIRPLFIRKKPSQPGDWLLEHRESGQTYAQFRAAMPGRAFDRGNTIRIVPIGEFTKSQFAVLSAVQEFLRPFFGAPVAVDETVPIEEIPADAQRQFLPYDPPQLLTSYLRNQVLKQRLRKTDAVVLGLTAHDLWPGAGWNFVFGEASLVDRVGVWSMARNGDPDGRPPIRKACMIRTVMTATHETGHMFGIRHCIAYECGMNGSNNSEERDRAPLEFCPECQPKLWWTLNLDPLERSRGLEAVARRFGVDNVAAALARQSRALAVR